MKYAKQIMWNLLKDTRNSSWRDLEEAETERSQQSRGNWKKTYDVFVEDNKIDAWTLLNKRANYILQKKIRMQMEAWTLLDGGSRLYALLHEARVRRDLILWSIEDVEIYIHGSSHEKIVRVQFNCRRRLLRRESLRYSWLSIQIRDSMMKRRSGISRAWNI